ncbi:serine/threonine-protein kinase [Streptomyces sp. WAC06614]|uniref:serine/threonine-protein kinase n=1 Tax=Streptomyces sp. WAC06614 TaxID=2487416 RepID=UPI00163C9A57|nr:serine/threonine-protein kinase [Streptomyces sp. WAC06614]
MWGRGTVLGDRYALTERIGGGGMGEVWRADDSVLRRQVAVKVLLPTLLDDPAFAARFRREATVLASLSHPGIVDVHDYGETEIESGERVAYIVMELVEGRPLNEVRVQAGPMEPAQALDIAGQALDALHAAHLQGVTHRDIKPSNLMLGGDGRVTVTDFGIARSSAASTGITDSHAVLGTALYMAPEQAEGLGAVAASDLYSMGVVVYELLTGEPPFTGESVVEIALKHVREPAPPLPEALPEPVRAFVARALLKHPEERYADASVMAAAARRAAEGRPLAELDAPAGPVVARPQAAAVTVRERKKWWQRLGLPEGVAVPVAVSVTVTATVAVTVFQVAPWAKEADAQGAGAQPSTSASAPAAPGSGSQDPGASAPPPTASQSPSPGVGGQVPPGQDPAGAGQGAGGGQQQQPGGGGQQPGGGGNPAQPGSGSPSGGGGNAGGGGQKPPTNGTPSGGGGGGGTSPGSPPQGCGGGVWGAITNVGDGLKVGLASNSTAAGTKVVMGGTTALGWVYERSNYESFHACAPNGSYLGRALTQFNETVRAELGGGGGVWWNLERVPGTSAYLIKDISFMAGCLTDNGPGKQLTVVPCEPNNKSQQWYVP